MQSFQEEVKAFLKQEDRLVPKVLAKVEKATGVSREHVAYALASVFSLYLVVGQRAQLICNGVGVVYPVLASFKAIQTADTRLSTQWLSYWSVFGMLTLVDALIGSWPLYWLLKCVTFLALYLPWFRLAERIYVSLAVPAFSRLWPVMESDQGQLQTEAEQTKDEKKQKPADATPPETPAEPRD